ncbi:MGDG synthase family glycosyltransferase [Planococcus sp. YIM B11945]|uniref:MGDG synthase family glycosyltransferase n=1 Tax=Planococcus sp. YIM B11945 TaxID=3435410 RepID=UPI003D7CDB27
MKKIVFFPLLNSMPSGHHQVADALCEVLSNGKGDIECKKIDLLSEWNRHVEAAAVNTYLKWIRKAPNSYAWVYRQLAYKPQKNHSFGFYEAMFLKKVERIVETENPDLIVCTHGFPSLFINKLKREGKCSVPCLNVYTDFFMNDVWGKSHIDYHFVPNNSMRLELQNEFRVPAGRIIITGIPVSPVFDENASKKGEDDDFTIMVSGGSTGLGNIGKIMEAGIGQPSCRYAILCGTNHQLYEHIKNRNISSVAPYPYIASKDEMNRLYSEADAIVTKPGGVTVSEALKKEVPIFIYSALPGQEEINLRFLAEQGLVFKIPQDANLPEFICETLNNKDKMNAYREAVKRFKDSLAFSDASAIGIWIEQVLAAE